MLLNFFKKTVDAGISGQLEQYEGIVCIFWI